MLPGARGARPWDLEQTTNRSKNSAGHAASAETKGWSTFLVETLHQE